MNTVTFTHPHVIPKPTFFPHVTEKVNSEECPEAPFTSEESLMESEPELIISLGFLFLVKL